MERSPPMKEGFSLKKYRSHNNIFLKPSKMSLTVLQLNNYTQQRNPQKQQQQYWLERQKQRIRCYTSCSGGNLLFSVAILMCLVTNGISKTNAVPTDSFSNGIVRNQLLKRTLRDITTLAIDHKHEDSVNDATVAAAALTFPAIQPSLPLKSVTSSTAAAALTSAEASSSAAPLIPQTQGLCLLDGVLVVESTVFCEKQHGCRAIQKTGHCCPDYKCDCEREGKTYSNGDKLVDPETPCTVCYCKGGEILCSSVTCFHRDDCSPKYIAGRCCPEYDNCPVPNPDPNTTVNKTILDPPIMTSTHKAEVKNAVLNPEITIKEITKPTEIRITDENKAIPIHQMLKPSTTESTTTTAVPTSPPTTTTIVNILKTVNSTQTATNADTTVTVVTNSEGGEIASNEAKTPIGPVKHNSTDTNLSGNSSESNGSGNENKKETESLKLSVSVAYDSSNNEQFSRVGSSGTVPANGIPRPKDAAMTLDENGNNGNEKLFGSFGEQGLQRVEPGDTWNDKVNIKREFSDTTEASASYQDAATDGAKLPSSIGQQKDTEVDHSMNNINSPNEAHNSAEDADPDAAGSDNIIHIFPGTNGSIELKGSTEGYAGAREEISKNLIQEKSELLHTNHTSESNQSTVLTDETVTTYNRTTPNPEQQKPLDNGERNSNQHHNQHQHLSEDEDSTIPVESNPAYPSLPEDDFSLRDVNFPIGEGEEMVDEPRSIGGPVSPSASKTDGNSSDAVKKSTKHLVDTGLISSGGGSDDNEASMESFVQFPSSSSSPSPTTTIDPRHSTRKINLIYSMEDVSEETTIFNTSDFAVSSTRGSTFKDRTHESGSGESQESESVESFVEGGSGAGSAESSLNKSVKYREPTTRRPNAQSEPFNIDELGSADDETQSSVNDPKLDAESLKLEESHEHSELITSARISAEDIKALEGEHEKGGGDTGNAYVIGVADMLFGKQRFSQRFH